MRDIKQVIAAALQEEVLEALCENIVEEGEYDVVVTETSTLETRLAVRSITGTRYFDIRLSEHIVT